jgi:hypothetical protein
MVKSIATRVNGTVEIVGNFKPRGRYKTVVLWIQSIVNWDYIHDIFQVKRSPYFCTKCKIEHRNGDIYETHKSYIGSEDDLIPSDRILKYDIKKVPDHRRGIAQRQIESLLNRMSLNPDRADLYRHEINKLILYENIQEEELW